MRNYLFICFLIIAKLSGYSQDFEGRFYLEKKTLSDTTFLTYSIKSNNIRIDEFDKYRRPTQSFIINIAEKSIVVINPSKKLFTNIQPRPINEISTNELEVIKSDNWRFINGYKCYQWRIKNRGQNTEISYWVPNDKFSFFDDMVKAWNSSDKNLAFFLQIPELQGYMPMEAVERTLLRDEKCRLEVLDISKAKIDDSIFQIPDNYKALQANR